MNFLLNFINLQSFVCTFISYTLIYPPHFENFSGENINLEPMTFMKAKMIVN